MESISKNTDQMFNISVQLKVFKAFVAEGYSFAFTVNLPFDILKEAGLAEDPVAYVTKHYPEYFL